MSNTAINNVDIVKKVFDINDLSFSNFTGSIPLSSINSSHDAYNSTIELVLLELNKVTNSISSSIELSPLPTGFKVIYLTSLYAGYGVDGIITSEDIEHVYNICQIRHGVVDTGGNYRLRYVGACVSQPQLDIGTLSSACGRVFFTEAPFIANQETAYFAGIRACINIGELSPSSLNFLFMLSRLKIYALRVRIA